MEVRKRVWIAIVVVDTSGTGGDEGEMWWEDGMGEGG